MDLIDIINRIGYIRTRAKLSARALSLKIGKNASYINRLETAKDFEPSISTLLDILEACSCSVEEFFYYDIMQYSIDLELLTLMKKLKHSKKCALKELLLD